MRETLWTTVGLIIASAVMATLMVMAVDALDFEMQTHAQRVAEHVARIEQ
jgi:hypothetical protein